MITARSALTSLLVLGIVFGIIMRIIFPAADPPPCRQTGVYWQDRSWSFPAKNAVVFGQLRQENDAWRPWTACPVHTLAMRASFHLFGQSPAALALPPMTFGIALLLLAYWQARLGGFSVQAGLVSSFFLATSWSLVGFSRIAVLEPALLFFYSLSVTLILAAESSPRNKLIIYFTAGCAAGLAVLSKTSGIIMALPLCAYLLCGAAVHDIQPAARYRPRRFMAYCAGASVISLAGFFYWIYPDWESFQQLVLKTSLTDRAGSSLFMSAYKAITWIDAQNFLTSPLILSVTLLLLPLVIFSEKGGDKENDSQTSSPGSANVQECRGKSLRRFTLGMCITSAIAGIALVIPIDVPARRTVFVNLFLAVLAGASWDWANTPRPAQMFRFLERMSKFRGLLIFAAAIISGLLCSGWLLSPNGGLISVVSPVAAARILFTMKSKIIYKAAWLALGLLLGLALYMLRTAFCKNAKKLMLCAIIFQFILFTTVSGLWFSRLSFTLDTASKQITELLPPETHVLSPGAPAICMFNKLRCVYWSPGGYLFANHDEEKIREDFNPQYMLVTEHELGMMRGVPHLGAVHEVSPYIESFLDTEIARFPIYEIHESRHLEGAFVLLKKKGLY